MASLFKINPTQKQFFFWQQWLFWSSILFALFGIIYAIYENNPLFHPYNESLAQIFYNKTDLPDNVKPIFAFNCGPMGGTIACCYLLLAFIAKYPFRKKEIWARNAIMVAFGTWVLLDSANCIYYGVYFQIYIINAFSIMVKALPIIFTWKAFRD